MTQAEIFAELRAILVELFQLEPERVEPDAQLFEELDLDSIDAVDLVARLQQFTGQRIDEASMRQIRTVSDLVELVAAQLSASRAVEPGSEAGPEARPDAGPESAAGAKTAATPE